MQTSSTAGDTRRARQYRRTPRSDLGTLRSDFGTFLSTLKDNASSRAQAEVDVMRQRVATLAGRLQATGQQQVQEVEGKVHERPFVSLAIVFATGFVTARLLDRR